MAPSPPADRLEIAGAHPHTRSGIETRPGKSDRAADERRGASLIVILIVEDGRDAGLPDDFQLGCGAQLGERASLSEVKEQWTDVACNLCIDDRKQFRPSTSSSFSPNGQHEPAVRTQDAPHFPNGSFGSRHIHESKYAQRNIKAVIGQLESLGIHALEAGIRQALLPGAHASGFDHATGQVHAHDLTAGRYARGGLHCGRAGPASHIHDALSRGQPGAGHYRGLRRNQLIAPERLIRGSSEVPAVPLHPAL